MTGAHQLLEVRNLSVAYRQGGGWSRAVDDVSFSLKPGEVFGLVGESGCGKSTVALQLLGFRHVSMRVEQGDVRFKSQALTSMSRAELDKLRGDRIAFVPQNPTTALNPGIRIGRQLTETMLAHGRAKNAHDAGAIASILKLVGLPADLAFQRRYPHQLSGGQQQRVCIAMALACDPDLLVLDEPTTGLDVTTQAQIISLLSELRVRIGVAMLYVTHDLALLSQIADRIGVMYAGRMVEIAPTDEIFLQPRHPYTQGLIASIPIIEDLSVPRARPLRGLLRRRELPPGCPFAPRCDHALEKCVAERQELEPIDDARAVACWRWREIAPVPAEPAPAAGAGTLAARSAVLSVDHVSVIYGPKSRGFRAVSDASFEIKEGEVFALVGESGSGKSTLARAISGLAAPASGVIKLRGEKLAEAVRDRSDQQRRLIQYIFQNPDASLNPRARIGEAIARPLVHFFKMEGSAARTKVADALDDVRLDGSYQERFPDQLSGGERQRVAIARALAAKPALLLCDEILSALDVSVQANILTLLRQLKSEHGIAMLFISHDLAVVRMLADHVCVLYGGEVMETGPREQVFAPPFHPYTHSLLHAVPVPLQRPDKPSKAPTAAEPRRGEAGCVYAGRCAWQVGSICETERPPWREGEGGLGLRCHLTLDQLHARRLAADVTGRNCRMKITKIECFVLLVPDYRADACSSAQDDLVVKIHTDEGLVGIGETDTNPWVARAMIEAPGTHIMGLGLTEMLMGKDPTDVEGLWDKMYTGSAMTGRRGLGICAMGALDMALWDLRGKAEGKPCWQLLGGAVNSNGITPYASLLPDGDDLDTYTRILVERAVKAKQLGFRAAKLEICIKGRISHNSLQVADDRECAKIVAACRKAVGPEMTLMVDVAYAWADWKEALRAIDMFADQDIYFIETPLPSDDIEGYAKLVKSSPVRVAAGEWLNSRFEFRELMDRDALDVVQPDVGRVGGLTEARRVTMAARDKGLAVVPHCWKSAIGIAASAHLAAVSPTCTYIEFLPRELADSSLRKDLCSVELPVVDGRIPLPTAPGLGVIINEEALASYRVK